MKISEQILHFLKAPSDEFKLKYGQVFGRDCVLITPSDMGTHWNAENSIFRSCLCDCNSGQIYNIGFRKFVNFSERPEYEPWDNEWKVEARHKIDGSLLCISKIDKNVLARTRGVFDATVHETGDEIETFKNKYPLVFDNEYINSERYTILCEHTTPNRVIVIREHSIPTLTLLGIISHDTCKYVSQDELDECAIRWGVNRPEKYEYASVSECLADVAAWKGKEGVVLCSPDGQTLKKIKADLYLELHKVSTGYTNINQVLDLFMTTPRFPDWKDFYTYVETTLDYEVAEKLCGHIGKISDSYKLVLEHIDKIHKAVDMVRGPSFTRKDQALFITGRWDDWRKVAAFQILDNRELDDKVIRKGIETYLLYD
jgi:hypothetical protein